VKKISASFVKLASRWALASSKLKLQPGQNLLELNGGGKKVTVGIITLYKLQLKCIQREFKQVLNSEEGKGLYINTVDAFQGQERDIISK